MIDYGLWIMDEFVTYLYGSILCYFNYYKTNVLILYFIYYTC